MTRGGSHPAYVRSTITTAVHTTLKSPTLAPYYTKAPRHDLKSALRDCPFPLSRGCRTIPPFHTPIQPSAAVATAPMPCTPHSPPSIPHLPTPQALTNPYNNVQVSTKLLKPPNTSAVHRPENCDWKYRDGRPSARKK